MPHGIKEALRARPAKREKLKPPDDYSVILLNDDYTTRDFVVEVIIYVFHKSEEEAKTIMLRVHHTGRGVVAVYTRDIALTKAKQVRDLARANGFPLQCVVEKA
jgi:ATP-dependent Clp protease adaptor protein ClpS